MSRLDDLVSDIETGFNDATVAFSAGSLSLDRNRQQRQIIFVRQRGTLNFNPTRDSRVEGAVVGGVGQHTDSYFTRREQIEVTLRAEDETALDTLFDRFVNYVHDTYGNTAFPGTNQYQWTDLDSTSSDGYKKRNPSIRLLLSFLLASRSDPRTFIQVAGTTADLGVPDETKPDAVAVVNP